MEEDEVNYSPHGEAGESPGVLRGGLSGDASLVSDGETLKRWGEWRNLTNMAENSILNYRDVIASQEKGIQWLPVARAITLEECFIFFLCEKEMS